MRLVHAQNQGAPIGLIKVHPRHRRFVAFSATVDEAVLWGWDFGCLERVARLGQRRERNAVRKFSMSGIAHQFRKDRFDRDIAFHPDGVHLATAGEGRAIEVYRAADGELVRVIGETSRRAQPVEYPPEHQGFDRIMFTDAGRILVASPSTIQGTQVLDFDRDATIGCLWGGFAPFSRHPVEELLALVRNDQGGATIRFARVCQPFRPPEKELGWDSPRVKVSDDEQDTGLRRHGDGRRERNGLQPGWRRVRALRRGARFQTENDYRQCSRFSVLAQEVCAKHRIRR